MTERIRSLIEVATLARSAGTALGRFVTVEARAPCAEFRTSANDFVTGEVLYADGGWQAYAWGAGDQ